MNSRDSFTRAQIIYPEARLMSLQQWRTVRAFLLKYGYLEKGFMAGEIEASLELAGRALLRDLRPSDHGFWGELARVAASPRCGVHEVFQGRLITGSAIAEARRPLNLTYWIQKDPPDGVTQAEMKNSIHDALVEWSSVRVDGVSIVTFSEVQTLQAAQIKIRWASLGDGLNGDIGHATKVGPQTDDGLVRFDSDDSWTAVEDNQHFHIGTIALHEVGHCLGLEHSNDPKHSMYSGFGKAKDISLDQADKDELVRLYP